VTKEAKGDRTGFRNRVEVLATNFQIKQMIAILNIIMLL